MGEELRSNFHLIGKVLALGGAALMIVSFLQQTAWHLSLIAKPIWLLDADVEKSIPTWFSVVMLFTTALFMAANALSERRRVTGLWRYWLVLAVGFVAMSLDEHLELHERAQEIGSPMVSPESSAAWMMEWFPLPVAFFTLLFFRSFLLRLPRHVTYGLIFAGGLYGTGIIGIELFVNTLTGHVDHHAMAGAALVTAEESFEIAGTLAALYVVSSHWLSLQSDWENLRTLSGDLAKQAGLEQSYAGPPLVDVGQKFARYAEGPAPADPLGGSAPQGIGGPSSSDASP